MKHALAAIQAVSETHGMAWNDNSMLALATEFISEQKQGDAFFAFCLKAAADQGADSNSAGAPEPDDDGPGFFGVDVCRCGFGHKTLRIKADSAAEAQQNALDEAGNHQYSEKSSEYSVAGVTRLNEDNICRTCGVDESHCGDGYDGECANCADKTEAARLRRAK